MAIDSRKLTTKNNFMKKTKVSTKKKVSHSIKPDVMLSDCEICNGNGYFMKIGDYDGKIKGRVKCPRNH